MPKFRLFAKHPSTREAFIWGAALLALACYNPAQTSDFTLCPLALAGIENCPGCGLGHSISHLLRGHWQASWQAHGLGAPVLALLVWRIFSIFNASQKTTIP